MSTPEAPPSFPPGVQASIAWLQSRFAWYYSLNPPPLPHRFTKREFGFDGWPSRPDDRTFVRHRAFGTAADFREFLVRQGPRAVYYSTAYYDRPGALKMQEKGWKCAELIFDLDADHLRDVEAAKAAGNELSLAEQLRLVKEQFKRLLDEFLLGDFGLSEKDVWITFSGGRGYHAHVVEDKLMQLDSKGRREIVDYITGKFPADRDGNVDLSHMMKAKVVKSDEFRGHVAKTQLFTFATPDSPGWDGRLARGFVAQMEAHLLGCAEEDAVKWLVKNRLAGPKSAHKFVQFMTRDRIDAWLNGRFENGTWKGKGVLAADAGKGNVALSVVRRALSEWYLPLAKGETDEPVTADVKRLIRLPGSLHGKSGLRVVTLDRSSLDAFEPLRDAVAFGRDPVRIKVRKDAVVDLAGEVVRVKGGEEADIPEAHAVFLLSRQGGTIVPKA